MYKIYFLPPLAEDGLSQARSVEATQARVSSNNSDPKFGELWRALDKSIKPTSIDLAAIPNMSDQQVASLVDQIIQNNKYYFTKENGVVKLNSWANPQEAMNYANSLKQVYPAIAIQNPLFADWASERSKEIDSLLTQGQPAVARDPDISWLQEMRPEDREYLLSSLSAEERADLEVVSNAVGNSQPSLNNTATVTYTDPQGQQVETSSNPVQVGLGEQAGTIAGTTGAEFRVNNSAQTKPRTENPVTPSQSQSSILNNTATATYVNPETGQPQEVSTSPQNPTQTTPNPEFDNIQGKIEQGRTYNLDLVNNGQEIAGAMVNYTLGSDQRAVAQSNINLTYQNQAYQGALVYGQDAKIQKLVFQNSQGQYFIPDISRPEIRQLLESKTQIPGNSLTLVDLIEGVDTVSVLDANLARDNSNRPEIPAYVTFEKAEAGNLPSLLSQLKNNLQADDLKHKAVNYALAQGTSTAQALTELALADGNAKNILSRLVTAVRGLDEAGLNSARQEILNNNPTQGALLVAVLDYAQNRVVETQAGYEVNAYSITSTSSQESAGLGYRLSEDLGSEAGAVTLAGAVGNNYHQLEKAGQLDVNGIPILLAKKFSGNEGFSQKIKAAYKESLQTDYLTYTVANNQAGEGVINVRIPVDNNSLIRYKSILIAARPEDEKIRALTLDQIRGLIAVESAQENYEFEAPGRNKTWSGDQRRNLDLKKEIQNGVIELTQPANLAEAGVSNIGSELERLDVAREYGDLDLAIMQKTLPEWARVFDDPTSAAFEISGLITNPTVGLRAGEVKAYNIQGKPVQITEDSIIIDQQRYEKSGFQTPTAASTFPLLNSLGVPVSVGWGTEGEVDSTTFIKPGNIDISLISKAGSQETYSNTVNQISRDIQAISREGLDPSKSTVDQIKQQLVEMQRARLEEYQEQLRAGEITTQEYARLAHEAEFAIEYALSQQVNNQIQFIASRVGAGGNRAFGEIRGLGNQLRFQEGVDSNFIQGLESQNLSFREMNSRAFSQKFESVGLDSSLGQRLEAYRWDNFQVPRRDINIADLNQKLPLPNGYRFAESAIAESVAGGEIPADRNGNVAFVTTVQGINSPDKIEGSLMTRPDTEKVKLLKIVDSSGKTVSIIGPSNGANPAAPDYKCSQAWWFTENTQELSASADYTKDCIASGLCVNPSVNQVRILTSPDENDAFVQNTSTEATRQHSRNWTGAQFMQGSNAIENSRANFGVVNRVVQALSSSDDLNKISQDLQALGFGMSEVEIRSIQEALAKNLPIVYTEHATEASYISQREKRSGGVDVGLLGVGLSGRRSVDVNTGLESRRVLRSLAVSTTEDGRPCLAIDSIAATKSNYRMRSNWSVFAGMNWGRGSNPEDPQDPENQPEFGQSISNDNGSGQPPKPVDNFNPIERPNNGNGNGIGQSTSVGNGGGQPPKPVDNGNSGVSTGNGSSTGNSGGSNNSFGTPSFGTPKPGENVPNF